VQHLHDTLKRILLSR